MIKDRILFSQNFSDLSSNCHSCKKNDHRLTSCPIINPFNLKNRHFFIQKIIFSKPQKRKYFVRQPKNLKTDNALLDRKKFMKKALNVRFNKDLMAFYLTKKIKNEDIHQNFSNNYFQKQLKRNSSEKNINPISEGWEAICSKCRSEVAFESNSNFLKAYSFLSDTVVFHTPNKIEESVNTYSDPIKNIEISEEPNKNLTKARMNHISHLVQNNENKSPIHSIHSDNRGFQELAVEKYKKTRISTEDLEEDSAKMLNFKVGKYLDKQCSNQTKIVSAKLREGSPKLKERNSKAMFFKEFENMKEYRVYFPEMNASKIIRSKKRISKMKKHSKLV